MASFDVLVLELHDDEEEDVLVEDLLGPEEVLKERVDCVKLGDLVGCTLPSRSDVVPSDTSVFLFLAIP